MLMVRSYYYLPEQPTQQPQPAIHDPVLNITFPANLTNPHTLPDSNPDPVYLPEPLEDLSQDQQHVLVKEVIHNLTQTIESNFTTPCQQCKTALTIAKPAALYAPALVPEAMVSLCQHYQFKSNTSCVETYATSNLGAIWTQVLANADTRGLDGEYICSSLSSTFCSRPHTSPLNTTTLFPKPKPVNALERVPGASGQRVKVLHLSDVHLDARYLVHAEANCSSSMCCRVDQHSAVSPDQVVLPASLYGAYTCDSPYDLVLAALQAVGPLTGTGTGTGGKGDMDALALTLYTGDIVSHDPLPQESRAYLEYAETSVFDMLKTYLTGPVFAALGNHDSSPIDIGASHSFPGRLGEQQSWNYDHLAGLWTHEGWIDQKTAEEARTHYGGYSIKTHYGLRIISFNTGKP